jgi:uncharacterized protein (UPF0548 family)
MLRSFTFRYPRLAQLQAHWQAAARLPHNYAEAGATRHDAGVPGYRATAYRLPIGRGPEDFSRAAAALRQWQHFANGWTRLYPARVALQPGEAVVVSFHLFGGWWHNRCRIRYLIDEADRLGYAYGTLPGHVARGEEYFGIYRDKDGSVFFEIKAFSQPVHPLARLFPVVFRAYQRHFVRQAGQAMRRFVHQPATDEPDLPDTGL